ncbi:calcium/sodium antiporter [Roseitranquillus sediminis]|uniref:calcium/sodium antiporter n=1 Tax=Roseitranquillus sediminis TaxID=2809051 RepID=UPI001D0C07E8|nr:calcium/sodium antiporter [Roseitranquillus sediminis]MBM9595653.1 calcium/sodium antiporter [Roseitranquillus sediminis]
MIWIELTAGLVLLLGGGEALVRGSVSAASRLGVSKLLIGLTLVGFGTSTPELVASLEAALSGSPGVAAGNIVGSNIANILLILGVSAALLPIATSRDAFRRDGTVLTAATLLMVAVILGGEMGRLVGGIFLILLLGYTLFSYFSETRARDAAGDVYEAEADEVAVPGMSLWAGLALAVAGIAGVIFGASLLVGSAIEIARGAGLSEAVIGLTLVALGTSLPELVTSVMAAVRRHGDVAFGNIVGSNVFNILGIAGTTALVSPFAVPPEIVRFDVWVMLAATLLLVVFAITGWRVSRREGALFLLAYAAYIFVQLSPGARAALGLS